MSQLVSARSGVLLAAALTGLLVRQMDRSGRLSAARGCHMCGGGMP